MALTISNESPIDLTGGLDTSNHLQIYYGSLSLADYDDDLYAYHNTEPVRIKIFDFGTWTLNATHIDDNEREAEWTRGSDHCYFDWYYTSGENEVTVVATSGAQQKTKKIHVKVEPIIELSG